MTGASVFPWIAAVLLGALAPALIAASLLKGITLLPYAFAITLGHAVILGLPAALVYRWKQWTGVSAAVAGGFLIGIVPGGFYAWPMELSLRTTGSVDGVPTIINGIPTLAGWFKYLEFLSILGAFGAVGGFVFWLTLRWCGVLAPADLGSARPVFTRSQVGAWLAGAAVAASIAVAAIPSMTKDRTCHNMFRDGRTSVGPKVSIDLEIAMDAWPRLTRLLEEFGASHGMSFRNLTHSQPAVVDVLSLSACTEAGLVITAFEQRWADPRIASLLSDRGVPIGVFDLHDGTGWQPLARDLIAMLDTEWRGKVRFRGDDGELVPKPAVLAPQNGSPPSR
jgi:hypothetical protein